MFAPPLAKSRTKATAGAIGRRAPRRPSLEAPRFGGTDEQAQMLKGSICSHAPRPSVVQRRLDLSRSASIGAGLAWDFARIATFPPGRASQGRGMSNSDADPGAADVGDTQQDPTPDTKPEADLVGPAGPVCAHPGKKREMFLQPVFLRTSAADPAPTGTSWMARYAVAAAVWSKLGVSVGARDAMTLDTPLKTAGADNHEANQVAALHSATDVDVLMVDNDMSWTGGATTFPVGGGAGSQTVMSDRGTSQTLLAHEVGHAFGLGHPPAGADANTVMQGTGSHSVANPTRNTMGNYRRIKWPAPTGGTCLFPDP
ncbi:MAG: M66 family metalloprotease [Xanthobacteraceae bacterium]|jgi:hypothetical protein